MQAKGVSMIVCGTRWIKVRVCWPRAGVHTGHEAREEPTICATQQALHIGDQRSSHQAGQKSGLIRNDGVELPSAAAAPRRRLQDYLDHQVDERVVAATVLEAGRI